MAKKFVYKDAKGNESVGLKLKKSEAEKVLTAHNFNQLVVHGSIWLDPDSDWDIEGYLSKDPKGCIIQIVQNNPGSVNAFDTNPAVAVWFDQNYNREWTVDELLDAMEKIGCIE